jgi:phytoene dehydrogenase-like protein
MWLCDQAKRLTGVHGQGDLAGRKLKDDVDLRLIDPFYRVRFADGDHFDYSGDPERMRSEVLRIDPTAGPAPA